MVGAISVAVVLAVGVALLELDASPAPPSPPHAGALSSTSASVTSTYVSTSATLTSTYVNGSSGLSLRLRINSTTLATGQNLSVSISDYNSADAPKNVSVAAQWPVSNLTLT